MAYLKTGVLIENTFPFLTQFGTAYVQTILAVNKARGMETA